MTLKSFCRGDTIKLCDSDSVTSQRIMQKEKKFSDEREREMA